MNSVGEVEMGFNGLRKASGKGSDGEQRHRAVLTLGGAAPNSHQHTHHEGEVQTVFGHLALCETHRLQLAHGEQLLAGADDLALDTTEKSIH
ncbi:hypothetical protein EYF80_011345 [Liparis tanakae]|uniref:Uncharacterized protein n=1 Tax=Liparis tanakae TaxID=230148 RepID=A0A4Z2IKQ8_9TELE|nr:hypothetical protein EYF80_011345 [Liparis tanakae]